MDLYVAII